MDKDGKFFSDDTFRNQVATQGTLVECRFENGARVYVYELEGKRTEITKLPEEIVAIAKLPNPGLWNPEQ